MSILSGLALGLSKGVSDLAVMGFNSAIEQKKEKARMARQMALAKYQSKLNTDAERELYAHRSALETASSRELAEHETKLKSNAAMALEDRKFIHDKELKKIEAKAKGSGGIKYQTFQEGGKKITYAITPEGKRTPVSTAPNTGMSALYNASAKLVVGALGGTILDDGSILLPKDIKNEDRVLEGIALSQDLTDRGYNPGTSANAVIAFINSKKTKEEVLAEAKKTADEKDNRDLIDKFTPFGKSESDVFGPGGREGFVAAEQQRMNQYSSPEASLRLLSMLYKTPEEVGAARKSNALSQAQAEAILKFKFGMD